MYAQKIFIFFRAMLPFGPKGTFQIEGNANFLSSPNFATVTEGANRGDLNVIAWGNMQILTNFPGLTLPLAFPIDANSLVRFAFVPLLLPQFAFAIPFKRPPWGKFAVEWGIDGVVLAADQIDGLHKLVISSIQKGEFVGNV